MPTEPASSQYSYLQKARTKLQQIPLSALLLRAGQWISQRKRSLSIALAATLLLLFTLGKPRLVTLQGNTLGVPYRIQYLDRWGRNHQEAIETLLFKLAQALDPTLPDTELARFNAHDCTDFDFSSPFLYTVLAKSKEIYQQTQGAFDPTVQPLVQAWAENKDHTPVPASRLQEYVSLDYIVANAQRGKKLKEGVQLDFRGILKGHAADVVTEFLKGHGIQHLQVTLDSEAIAHGQPGKHRYWQRAIQPQVAILADIEQEINLNLVNQAVAITDSSKQDKESPHNPIIDPTTGCPAQNTLLAAVVIAPDGSTADAYATAMMARGLAFAQTLLDQQKQLDAFLIYKGKDGTPTFYTSPNLHMEQAEHTITLRPAQAPS